MNTLIISTIIYLIIVGYYIYEFKKETIGETQFGIQVLLTSLIYISILLIFYFNFTVRNILRFISVIIIFIPVIITVMLESYSATCYIKSI